MADVPRDAREPKYRQIAEDLKAAISAGHYAPGDKLPGENALMKEYGVARMTARQALAALQNEGLTTTRKGAGVFVRSFRPIIRHGIRRLAQEQWRSGRGIWDADTEGTRDLTVDSIHATTGAADEHAAIALDIKPSTPVIIRSRRYVLDDRPIALATSVLPTDIAADTRIAEADTGPGGIYARLSDLGYAPAHFREDVRARMPLDDEAATITIEPGVPVIVIARTAWTAEGRPVEFNTITMDASVYVLRYDFDA